MKRAIVGGKQVGQVYYMCESLFAVRNILRSGEIKMSSKKEKSINTNKLEYFTSLTRNFKSLVAQKPNKWRDGIILDGDKLSDSYSIDPINFVGTSAENQRGPQGKLKISQITRWPSRCMIRFVGWSKELQIALSTYLQIKAACLDGISDAERKKCKLEISQGKRNRGGEKFIERLKFNTPGGSPPNIFTYLPESALSELASVANQYEERIHGPNKLAETTPKRFKSQVADKLDLPVVHITDCVKGVVINSEDLDEYPELVEEITNLLESSYGLADSESAVITYTA